MEEKKRHTGLWVLIVILLCAGFGYGGYYYGTKLEKKQEPKAVDNSITTTTKKVEKVTIKDYNYRSRENINGFSIIDITNYVDKTKEQKNINFESGNNKFLINCSETYNYSNAINTCSKYEITINNNAKFFLEDMEEAGINKFAFENYNGYYIIQHLNYDYGYGKIEIYKEDGQLVKTIEKTISEYNVIESNVISSDIIEENYFIVSNNMLYYITTDNIYETTNYIHLNEMDLDTLAEKEIDKLNAYTTQQRS